VCTGTLQHWFDHRIYQREPPVCRPTPLWWCHCADLSIVSHPSVGCSSAAAEATARDA
jgi:hypothetical protein